MVMDTAAGRRLRGRRCSTRFASAASPRPRDGMAKNDQADARTIAQFTAVMLDNPGRAAGATSTRWSSS